MIGGGVGQCRGYPANMPAHDDDDPYLPEGGLTQLSDGELWDLMDVSLGEATDRSNNTTPAGINEFLDQATATGPPLIPPDGGRVSTGVPRRSPPAE